MAWIYLAELGESHLPWSRGSEQSPTVKTTDTLKPYYCRTCGTVNWISPQFGMMCVVFEGHRCPTKLISSREASHVRTLVLQEMEQVWLESAAGYSSKSLGSLANFDPDSFSWKTSQQSLFGGLSEFAWNSLRWGMIVGGRLFQPANLVPRTCEKGGGFVPTPCARDYKSPGLSRQRRAAIEDNRGVPLSVWFKENFGANLHPTFIEWMMGYRLKHTVLEPWAMQWFRSKREQRLKG